jgi:hypothetical protein
MEILFIPAFNKQISTKNKFRKKKKARIFMQFLQLKLLIRKISPLHWYDSMCDFKWGLEELMPKKNNKNKNDSSGNTL